MDLQPEQPEAVIVPLAPPAPVPPALTAADYRRHFFFGPFGLRAIWSLLIYIALVATLILSVNIVHRHIVAKRKQAAAAAQAKASPATTAVAQPAAPKPNPNLPQPMRQMILIEGLSFAALYLFSLLMARIERRRVAVYGLGGTSILPRFAIGAFWGLAAQSILILCLHTFHYLTFDKLLLHGPAIAGWGAVQLLAFLLVGFVEEYMFRGYLQFTLYRGMVSIGNLFSPPRARSTAFWIAAVLTSALFLAAHTGNSGETLLGLFQVFLAGILFLVALWRTGSLWWAIGFHMSWDWAQSFLYGVPDSGGLFQGRLFATHATGNVLYSGGTVGPEGSVLCIPIFLLAIVVVLFTKPSPQPPIEPLPPKAKPATA
jgi:membrane protease YdiL (CAAX protease family)